MKKIIRAYQAIQDNITDFNQLKITELEKISDFYFCDIDEICDEKFTKLIIPAENKFKINPREISEQDFDSIAGFGLIVKNYTKMIEIEKRNK